jgi:hypothetical protein
LTPFLTADGATWYKHWDHALLLNAVSDRTSPLADAWLTVDDVTTIMPALLSALQASAGTSAPPR